VKTKPSTQELAAQHWRILMVQLHNKYAIFH
jgi:hypothetical protein